jgi:hypothetical protein
MKGCSHFHRNKRNNICKTTSTPPYHIPIDTVIVRDIKQMLLYDWCNAVNQKNILQRPCSKMPAAPAREAKPTPTESILHNPFYKRTLERIWMEFERMFSFSQK